MSKENINNEVKVSKKVIVKGILTSCYYGKSKLDKDNNKFRLSIKVEQSEVEKLRNKAVELKTYETTRLVPKWFTDDIETIEYLNFKSIYDLPLKHENETTTLEDVLSDNDNYLNCRLVGSECRISVTLKEGAIYPNAIMIDKAGEVKNPFSDFED